MQEQLLTMIVVATGCAPLVTGITEVIKRNTKVAGLGLIITAVLTGVLLFSAVAYVFDYPMTESILMGLLTGFASVGAFEGVKHTKGA